MKSDLRTDLKLKLQQGEAFATWLAGFDKYGQFHHDDKGPDVFLGTSAAARFVIGLVDLTPTLGIPRDIDDVRWTNAAFVRGYKDADWVCLAAKDARINEDPAEPNPVGLRLWLPTAPGLLDVWFKPEIPTPKQLQLRHFDVGSDGRASGFSDRPLALLPLTLLGRDPAA